MGALKTGLKIVSAVVAIVPIVVKSVKVAKDVASAATAAAGAAVQAGKAAWEATKNTVIELKSKAIELKDKAIDALKALGEYVKNAAVILGKMLVGAMVSALIISAAPAICMLRTLGLAGKDHNGLDPTSAFGNDPVNMSTGNFVYQKDDIEISGQFPFVFQRFYNAMDNYNGVIGRNWTHNFNIFLRENDRNVKIIFDDGHVEEYLQRKDGSYKSPPDRHNTLTYSDGAYHLSLSSLSSMEMKHYSFDKEGRLISISDPNGNTLTLSYERGSLVGISNVCGSLSFVYNDKNRIIKITDHAGRTVSYEYNGDYLKSATHPSGAVHSYKYDQNGNICDIINPLGITVIHNEYDGRNRTVKQLFPDDGFSLTEYDDDQFYVINTEQNGNKVVYVHDEKYRTTRIQYDNGEERFGYNKNSERILYTDRNGNSRTFGYDERGSLISETDPMGGVTETEYSDFNRPLKITNPDGGVTRFEYDPKGNIIRSVDPLMREMRFECNHQGLITGLVLPDESNNKAEYDERGNIIAIISPDGGKTQYEYDSLNRVIKTTDGEKHVTLFEYNSKGDISSVTNAGGNTRRYEYSLSDKVTRITDFNGGIIEYKYNSVGKVEQVVDQMGGVTTFAYDLMWNVTGVTDPNGNTTRYVYDQYQRVIQSIDEEGSITEYEHDPNGNVVSVTSPAGTKKEIKYDALNRQREMIGPDGAVTKFLYDKGGNLAEVTDALGNVTKREYDLAGQLVKLTDALGNETQFTYTPLGRIESIVNAKGDCLLYGYYPGGRLKSVSLPCGEAAVYEYDKNGNVIKITDVSGSETSVIYDCLDRVVEIINPLGFSKKFSYDAVGNITGVTDENGNVTQYRYSLLGDIIEVIDAAGHGTKYGYDETSRLTKFEQCRIIDKTYASVKCPECQITTYERNKKGEIVAVTSPLGDVVRFQYDKAGNVISKLDEEGLETLYEYNLAGSLATVSYADGRTVEFSYNALRQLTTMRDWLGTTKIEPDELGRAKRVADSEGREVGYVWNPLGQKEKLIYPGGASVDYEYNASGNLTKVVSGTDETSYSYDIMGRPAGRMLPDGTATKYDINSLGRLTRLTHSNGERILDEFKYTYDPAGNISEIEKNRSGIHSDSGIFQYTYDSLGRLVKAIHRNQTKEYRYDALGNRVEERGSRQQVQHSYNARNQLIKTQEGNLTKEYSYNKRGNLTGITENGRLKAKYEFDATNMMVSAFAAGKGTAEYGYNGFRNRVRKLETLQGADTAMPDPTCEIRYTLDMTLPYDNLLMMHSTQNQSFVWGNSLLSSNGGDGGDKFHFHYLQDHLGSPIRLLGDDIDTPMAYDEFGVPLAGSGQNQNNPFGFTGYQTDDVSGLYYAQARYYQPMTGRFTSEDFVRDGVNIYLYCRNNPLRFVDRNGLWVDEVHYKKTLEWAIAAGFTEEQAEKIARYTSAIDYDPEYNPITGDQSYHFDRNTFGTDSRIENAQERFKKAAEYRDQGLEEEAFKELGYGLHALQDIEAHGNIGINSFRIADVSFHMPNWVPAGLGGKIDKMDYVWANDARTRVKKGKDGNTARLDATEKVTMNVFNSYRNCQ